MSEMNFGKQGNQFQQALIKSIIEDAKYGEQIMEVLESRYFDNNSFKYIVTHIKELQDIYKTIPTYETLKQKIMTETANNPLAGRLHSETLQSIENLKEVVVGETYVKDTALNFCKQQNLRKTMSEALKIIDKGDFESYDKISEMVNQSLQVGATDDDIIDIFDDLDNSLDIDPRVPIPTGISGLDDLLKGGIGVGELGMVLAPTGVGKSTILTKFANTAANTGHKVVQIFFEDTRTQIRQKHFTCWSGLSKDQQVESPEAKLETIAKAREAENREGFGGLKIIRMRNYDTTVSDVTYIDGLLRITLTKEVPEEQQRKVLTIN